LRPQAHRKHGAPLPRAIGGRIEPKRRALLSVAVAANLLPAALLFYFVHRFGVDLPQWDEWDCFVVALQRFHQGTLGFTALFAQQNEHRMAFPRLLTLANAALFHWDRTAEMYATAVLLIFCAALLYRFLRAYWAHPLATLFFVPAAWMLLSWRQWENLVMGIGTAFSLLAAGSVLAFLMLYRTRRCDASVGVATAAAFVATFSSAGGLFLWPVGAAQLLLQRFCAAHDDKPGFGAFAVWTSAGIASWIVFFFGYQQRPVAWPTGLAYVVHHPIEAVQFVAGMIGSPISDRLPIARVLGVMVFALSVRAVLRLRRTPAELMAASPLLALLSFTLLNCVASCDRRMGMGAGQMLASRYCTFTMMGAVALYGILTRIALIERRSSTWFACSGFAGLLLAGALTSYVPWRVDPAWHRDPLALGTYAIRYADVVSDEAASSLYPDPEVARRLTPFLRAHRYSLFHRDVPMGLPALYDGSTAGCAIDAVNGRKGLIVDVHRRADSAGLRVTGQVSSEQKPSRVFASIDNRIDGPALLVDAGFISYVRTSLLTDGEHALQLKIVSRDGASYRTCGDVRLRVAE
jgi:hypothetical protein